jgi:hypothetical protein
MTTGDDIGSGGGIGDDSQFGGDSRSTAPEYTGGGAEAEQEPDTGGMDEETQYLNELNWRRQQVLDAGMSAYGPDPQKRWGGTAAIGLGIFQGHRQDRQPSFDRRGRVRGFRTAPGAPMATPPEGLIGGKALENAAKGVDVSNPFTAGLTPESDWRAKFKNTPGSTYVPMGNSGQMASPGQMSNPGQMASNSPFAY